MHLEKCQTLTVSLNFHLSLFHLLHQHGIPDDASSIPDFSASFIETSNDAYNRPLCYISECRQLVKGLKEAINSRLTKDGVRYRPSLWPIHRLPPSTQSSMSIDVHQLRHCAWLVLLPLDPK